MPRAHPRPGMPADLIRAPMARISRDVMAALR